MADLRRISDFYTKLAKQVFDENEELNYISELGIRPREKEQRKNRFGTV